MALLVEDDAGLEPFGGGKGDCGALRGLKSRIVRSEEPVRI